MNGYVTIRCYCRCGAKLTASSEPPETAQHAAEVFRELHSADRVGHGPASAKESLKARKRAYREYVA